MSTFRGTGVSAQAGAPHSPVMYNQPLGPHHSHTQHSPAIQNDTIVGKAMQTMFTSTEMFTPTVSAILLYAKSIESVQFKPINILILISLNLRKKRGQTK